MITIDRKNIDSFNMEGDEMTIAGELGFLMIQFIKKYGIEHFENCVKASIEFIKDKKCKNKATYHIKLINENKKPLIIESDTLEGAIEKINKLKIPKQVKKYAIECLKINNFFSIKYKLT